MKKIILSISLFLSFFTVSAYTAFGASGDVSSETKSIKELKADIDTLKRDKKGLDVEFSLLNKDLKLKSFFREGLSSGEVKSLSYIINTYLDTKSKLEKVLVAKASNLEDTYEEKKKLLEEKKDLYKNLVPFIKAEQVKEYLEYVRQDAQILKEKQQVDTKLIMNTEIINNKVQRIEGRIKEHKQLIDSKVRSIIEQKLGEKLSVLNKNKNFVSLDVTGKRKVIDSIIENIHSRITLEEGKSSGNGGIAQSSLRKIEVYNIILLKLEDFKELLK